MSTLRQVEANRRNAQKSTGPTSVTGKAASSMNNLKTGIHAKSLVLPSESLADLQQLIEECYLHYHPANPEQRFYVDDLIRDRKSTRLNSSHLAISYAVSCLKKREDSAHEVARRRPRNDHRPSDTRQNDNRQEDARQNDRPNGVRQNSRKNDIFFLMIRRRARSTLFPNETLFRS